MLADGGFTEIKIWQVRKGREFPTGIKYAMYLIGPPPDREVLIGYDNHHGKGHHRHAGGIEAPISTTSVTAVLQGFRREVVAHLQAGGGSRTKGET